VESVEDEEWQRYPGDDSPCEEAIKLCLDPLGDVAVGHEGVQHPQGDVGEQHEGDDLAAWLGTLLGSGGADPATSFADDHSLQGHLDQEQGTLAEHHDALHVRDGDDGGQHAEDGVHVGPGHRDTGQEGVQLVWGGEGVG